MVIHRCLDTFLQCDIVTVVCWELVRGGMAIRITRAQEIALGWWMKGEYFVLEDS